MGAWEFFDFASKENLLRTVREQSDQMLALASRREIFSSSNKS